MHTDIYRNSNKTFFKFLFLSVFICVYLWTIFPAMAQNKPCKFDEKRLQFAGTPVEQARCLLRPNKIGGVLDAELKRLPKPLEKIIGKKVSIKKQNLRDFLKSNKISEDDLGGSLDEPLAFAKLPSGETISALYFVIHDTSTPYLKDEPFPENFDTDKNWRGNDLEVWRKNPVAHVFVNRPGESATTTPFSESVRKGFGTKFARDYLKNEAKALQIHIELHQPRRRDPNNSNANNDRFAPVPGFTEKQYEKLAMLYVCASVRRGKCLIPAYHSAIDAGIKGAHDDPQNFELEKFADFIAELLEKLA